MCQPKGREMIQALFLAIFTEHVKKSRSECEKVVAKFDSNEVNLSITDDGKSANTLGILKTLE